MTRPATVDIALPVRDASATIAEALDSIRRQTFTDFRCLVLDDGSRDDGLDVVRAFTADDPRFELHEFPPRGIVATLNDALRLATAPYVARMDADDRMSPERLERQLGAAERDASIDVVSSRVRFFGDGVSPGLLRYETWLNSLVTHDDIVRDLFVESPIPHPSVMMRTGALRRLGGYRDVPGPEDYDLWLRAWRNGMRFAKCEQTLVEIRDHAARLTKTGARYSTRELIACKAEHAVAGFGWEGRGLIVWGAGRDGKRIARGLRRAGAAIDAFVDIAPTKVGRSLLGVDVLPYDSLRSGSRCPIVVAVGTLGAREKIRTELVSWGFADGADFVCFA